MKKSKREKQFGTEEVSWRYGLDLSFFFLLCFGLNNSCSNIIVYHISIDTCLKDKDTKLVVKKEPTKCFQSVLHLQLSLAPTVWLSWTKLWRIPFLIKFLRGRWSGDNFYSLKELFMLWSHTRRNPKARNKCKIHSDTTTFIIRRSCGILDFIAFVKMLSLAMMKHP